MAGSSDTFFTVLGLVTAGVALAMSVIHFFLAIHRRKKSYLLFCIMSILLVAFFFSPPIGFILNDTPPYNLGLLLKRIFIFSYYGLTPWFFLAYTQYPKKWLASFISVLAVICYAVMSLTGPGHEKPFWSVIAVLAFGSIFILGVVSARWQYSHGDRKQGLWLGTVVGFYGILFFLTAINQLTNSGLAERLDMKLFFPMHFHYLFFMLVMGQQLVADLLQKDALERAVTTRDSRWRSFMIHSPFVIIELNLAGDIAFINDYGARLLGYPEPSELKGVGWFERFVKPQDRAYLKQLFHRLINDEINVPSMKSSLITRQGTEILIDWVNFPVADNDGMVRNVIRIGKDVTDEEKANQIIQKLKNELLKEPLHLEEATYSDIEIIGTSKALTYAMQKAKHVAPTQAPVLLEGETGVGKEMFANLIHNNSTRSQKPFIKVNCGALPKDLIEDELFGHEKGAFTSAHQARKGRFELADGGTIFLDEIGELPLDMQPKLLRVVQTGEFERIGGQKTLKVDVRILAATNRTLSAEIQKGQFRSDLFYRLNVFPITIPSLRNRNEDLPTLINYFIQRECKKYGKSFTEISRANLDRLLTYSWPGNIRELKNVIERAVINSDKSTLNFDWWGEDKEHEPAIANGSLEHIEREHILRTMERCKWKINGDDGAAKWLEMNPNTLRSKMKRLGIKRPDNYDSSISAASIR